MAISEVRPGPDDKKPKRRKRRFKAKPRAVAGDRMPVQANFCFNCGMPQPKEISV